MAYVSEVDLVFSASLHRLPTFYLSICLENQMPPLSILFSSFRTVALHSFLRLSGFTRIKLRSRFEVLANFMCVTSFFKLNHGSISNIFLQIGSTKKSTLPVVNTDLTLEHEEAFPGFFIPTLSMAHGKADPVLSMPDHTKFFLLRSLCNDLLQTNGLVYDDQGDGGFNALTAALLTGQAYLLEFGFQSTIEKIRDMTRPNAQILDGRSDQILPGTPFNPPERRFKDMGLFSDSVIGIKKAIIDEFFDLADLRVNYRLALLLGEFKSKIKAVQQGNHKMSMMSLPGWVSSQQPSGKHNEDALCYEGVISEWAGGFCVYALFEGLFQEVLPRQDDGDEDNAMSMMGMGAGGRSKHDAYQLEFRKLADKPDFDDVLLDTLLYDNDELMVQMISRLFDGHPFISARTETA